MKKLYTQIGKYLFNKNTEEGSPGAGGGGTGEGAAAPTQQPASGVGATGGNADWRASLPEDVRGHERIKDVASVADLAKMLVSMNPAPSVPEKMTLPAGIPEELGAWAVEKKLSQEQFDAVMLKHGEIEAAKLQGTIATQQAGMKQLYEEWGAAKSANLQLANRVLGFADPEGKLELAKFLKSPQSGYAMMNPIVVKLFYNLGKTMAESGILKSENPPADSHTQKVDMAYEMYPDLAPNKK